MNKGKKHKTNTHRQKSYNEKYTRAKRHNLHVYRNKTTQEDVHSSTYVEFETTFSHIAALLLGI